MRVLAVLAALILPVVAYYPVYQEREKTIETTDKEIHELEVHIEQAHAAQRKLVQFHEEVQRLNEETARLHRILPADPALTDVRDVVETTASNSAVRIERFQPRPAARNEYVEVRIDTEAVASIGALAEFFDTLRNKTRIINATDITLQKADAGRWRATFLLTAFALPD